MFLSLFQGCLFLCVLLFKFLNLRITHQQCFKQFCVMSSSDVSMFLWQSESCILIFSVLSCDDLTCGQNEICVAAGDTYECVCHPDYEGENCEVSGWFDLLIFLHLYVFIHIFLVLKAINVVKCI